MTIKTKAETTFAFFMIFTLLSGTMSQNDFDMFTEDQTEMAKTLPQIYQGFLSDAFSFILFYHNPAFSVYLRMAALVAIAVNEDGYREVLGDAEGMKEDKARWFY